MLHVTDLAAHVSQATAAGATVARGISDEAFGRQLQRRTPDGLLVKVNEIDRSLVESRDASRPSRAQRGRPRLASRSVARLVG